MSNAQTDESPAAGIPAAGPPLRDPSSNVYVFTGWYFKSLKYLYVAIRVGSRASLSGPHGSCGRVKYLHVVFLGIVLARTG